MYIIRKSFEFSASHCLDHLPVHHPCAHVHGHNYVVTVELRSEKLNTNGFVRDYKELDPVKKYIDALYDHKHLNDVMNVTPTAELIAMTLFAKFKQEIPELYAVEVCETPKTMVRYEGS